jgi:hypothetical protein
MPGFVARAGLADRVLPLDQIAAEISRSISGKVSDSERVASGLDQRLSRLAK